VDGNHDNDDPSNLLLVEVRDHMRLHDLPLQRILATKIKFDKKRLRDENDDALGIRRGTFTSKTINGKIYWYFQDNRTRRQHYVGTDSTDLRKKIESYNKSKGSNDQIAAWNSVKALVEK
jgi:hypothetical protein